MGGALPLPVPTQRFAISFDEFEGLALPLGGSVPGTSGGT
jgi:hypothetical protein